LGEKKEGKEAELCGSEHGERERRVSEVIGERGEGEKGELSFPLE